MRLVRVFSVLALLWALAVPAYAQQTGSIVGKVADNSGGVLPGVSVSLLPSVSVALLVSVSDGIG